MCLPRSSLPSVCISACLVLPANILNAFAPILPTTILTACYTILPATILTAFSSVLSPPDSMHVISSSFCHHHAAFSTVLATTTTSSVCPSPHSLLYSTVLPASIFTVFLFSSVVSHIHVTASHDLHFIFYSKGIFSVPQTETERNFACFVVSWNGMKQNFAYFFCVRETCEISRNKIRFAWFRCFAK